MKLSKRELILLILVFVIAAGALYYTRFYTPIKDDIKVLQDESDDLMIKINNLNMQKNRIPDLKNELSTLQNEFSELTSDFLLGWDEPLLLVYLENMIGDNAIKKKSTFYLSEPEAYYSSGTIDLELVTNYPNLKGIIKELEEAPYYNKIQAIDVKKQSGEDNKGDLAVTISTVFYTQDDPDFIQDDYDFMTPDHGKENIFE